MFELSWYNSLGDLCSLTLYECTHVHIYVYMSFSNRHASVKIFFFNIYKFQKFIGFIFPVSILTQFTDSMSPRSTSPHTSH